MRSKKRSAARHPQPPEPVTCFVDASLGRTVVELLRAAGFAAVAHDDLFAQGTPDTEWLPEIGARGLPVLTKDTRIRYTPAELEALRRAGVQQFVLVSGNLKSEQMAEAFIMAMLRMDRLVRKHRGPFVARLNRAGEITRVTRL